MKKLAPLKLTKKQFIDTMTDMVLDWWDARDFLDSTPYPEAQRILSNHIRELLESIDD